MVELKPKSDGDPKALDVSYVKYRGFRWQHLLLFVLGSAIVHGLIFLVLSKYQASQPIEEKEENEPIEFVVVPPEEKSEEPPPDTNNRSTENSVAPSNDQPKQTPSTEEIGEDIVASPAPAPTPAPTPAPAPKPTPSPPKPKPETTAEAKLAPEPSPQAKPEPKPTPEPAPEPAPEPEPVATRLPPKPEPPVSDGGSAADLLGGDYKKTLADGGSDAFFSPEALTHETVLNPGQIDALRDIDLSAYFAEIRRRVKRNWNPSYSSEEQSTFLTFKIQKNGQITDLKVARSSGSSKLDNESLAAVQNSAPFDSLPPNFPLEALEIEFSFNIYLY